MSDNATRVLFDAPGPKAKRRIMIGTILSILAIAGVLWFVLDRFYVAGQLYQSKWSSFFLPGIPKFILTGLLNTLKVAAVGALFAFPLGAMLALFRMSLNRPVRWLATLYIEFFRSTPLLLLVYIFVGALPAVGFNASVFWKITIPVIMVNAAVLAEVFRAGVLALPKGQSEAALSVGLTYWQSMRLVILPQAIRIVIPSLVTQLVSLLKDSTLGYFASYPELMATAAVLSARYHNLLPSYLTIAVVFVLINLALSYGARLLERRLSRTRTAGGDDDARTQMQAVEDALPTVMR